MELNEAYKKLKDIKDDKTIPYFSFKGKTFYALPCHIYDGDTFSVIFDYKGELVKYKCRCMGYDTAEMKPSLKDENRLEQKGLLKRFSMTCYGKQPTLESIRSEKAEKYQQLKNDKDNYEYKRLFFKYHPTKQSATMSSIKSKKKKAQTTTYKKPKKLPPKKKNTTKKKKKKFVLNIPVNNQKFLF
jgi:tRNA G10  N-methylase Trm11